MISPLIKADQIPNTYSLSTSANGHPYDFVKVSSDFVLPIRSRALFRAPPLSWAIRGQRGGKRLTNPRSIEPHRPTTASEGSTALAGANFKNLNYFKSCGAQLVGSNCRGFGARRQCTFEARSESEPHPRRSLCARREGPSCCGGLKVWRPANKAQPGEASARAEQNYRSGMRRVRLTTKRARASLAATGSDKKA
jgi:hypothetical protein